MKKYDLVSIIIPCYNQAQYLEEAVQSAIEQTYPNIEIIIINDGSPDNTHEVAVRLQKKYPENIQIISQANSGLYAARNNGIKKSSGYYIVPLDADDKLDKEMISKCIQMIQENNSDIVYTGFQEFGASNRINMWRPFKDTNPLYLTPCSATALFKRNVWDITGGYKNSMNDGYEDWEFWVNAYKHNFKFKHIPEKLFFYRIKEESMYLTVYKKDAYLKAKIVMIHPELYPTFRVQRSIDIIRNTEGLADLYFYTTKDAILNEKHIESIINTYLTRNKLELKQIIITPDQNIELYSLENLNDIEEMEKLIRNTQNKLIVFYSQIPYRIQKLKSSSFSWIKCKEMTKVKGTIFPYVFKSKREDPVLQNIACERMERFEAFNQDRIRNLLHNVEVSNQRLSILDLLMESLAKLTQKSILKNPLKKIKAYKELLSLYYLYKPTKIITQENDNNTLFIVDSAMKKIQIAFYLYRNDKHVDTQWYSQSFSYTLDKEKYGKGKYRIRYFIVSENTDELGNAKKLETGETEYIKL